VGLFAGTLAVTFSPTKNTYGTFAWQGDALTWSAPDLTRPQASAWYVCEGQQLFVNLGAYLSGTPARCADQTVSWGSLAPCCTGSSGHGDGLFLKEEADVVCVCVLCMQVHYYNGATASA